MRNRTPRFARLTGLNVSRHHHQQQDEVPSLQFTGFNFIAEILLRAEREILLQR